MTAYYDKYTIQQTLIKPIKLFGFPSVKNKIEALNHLKLNADTNDIEYVFPIVFEENTGLSLTAAEVVAGIMKKVEGRHWNNIYDEIKYTKVSQEMLVSLLAFPTDITVHLLGIASLNFSGYVREKALKLMSGIRHSCTIPYILLRLNDWVEPVRQLAGHILQNTLTIENIDIFIENSYLINKLQNVLRVDLKSTRQEIHRLPKG